MDRFDVLIAGAGPAGSFAAESLARAGVRVALLDGRPPGEPKACGGGVTSKALKAWPHLLDAVGRTIDELDMYSPSGKHLHLKLDEPFAVYSRIAFDTFLRERARAAGAEVFAEKVSTRGFKRLAGKVPGLPAEVSRDPIATTTPRGLPAWGPRSARGSDTKFAEEEINEYANSPPSTFPESTAAMVASAVPRIDLALLPAARATKGFGGDVHG